MAQGFFVGLPERVFDADNLPGDGWKIYTWVADGTFTTPLTTFSTATLSATNTNPIIADASGYFRAFVAQDISLDIQVKNASDVLQYSVLSLKPMASGFEDGATLTDAVLVSPTMSSVTNSDVKVLAADATAAIGTTGTTLTSLTGFSWTLVAGGTYAFRIRGKVGYTTNGGLGMAFKYTTLTLASILITSVQRTASVFVLASSTTTTDQTKWFNQKAVLYVDVELEGSLVVTTGGTLAVQFAQETAHADVTTVYKGMIAEFVRTA